MENLEKELLKEHLKFMGKLLLSGGLGLVAFGLAHDNIIPEGVGYVGYGLGWAGMVASAYQARDTAKWLKEKYGEKLRDE